MPGRRYRCRTSSWRSETHFCTPRGCPWPGHCCELHAHIPEDFNHEVAVGSKDGQAVRLSSIIGDSGAVREEFVRSDELPCADKRVRGMRLGMHGGDSEYHGSNERKDASDHECTVPSA